MNEDVVFGDPADGTNFTKGVKNSKIFINSSSEPTAANIDLYASVGQQIEFYSYATAPVAAPHIRANGDTKFIRVLYNEEQITTTASPFYDFQGDSNRRAVVESVRGLKTFYGRSGAERQHSRAAAYQRRPQY